MLATQIAFSAGPAAAGPPPPDSSGAPRYEARLLYSNDNIIRFLDRLFLPGDDDFVTMRLAARLAREDFFVDLSYMILTERSEGRRADLLTLRVVVEHETKIGTARIGGGIAGRGKYGGSTVQNTYHRLTRIPAVHVTYEEQARARPLVQFGYDTPEWPHGISFLPTAQGYFSYSYAADAGPAPLATGVEISCCDAMTADVYDLQLQGQFGYIRHYGSDPFLGSIFRSGFTWGGMASFGWSDQAAVASWMTRNEHGDAQPQYGIAITVGRLERQRLRLSTLH